jgi:hypothetical protein
MSRKRLFPVESHRLEVVFSNLLERDSNWLPATLDNWQASLPPALKWLQNRVTSQLSTIRPELSKNLYTIGSRSGFGLVYTNHFQVILEAAFRHR